MRRALCTPVNKAFSAAALCQVRFSATKKYDLFGYEVDTNTAPWIKKIEAVKNYDDAGEIMVDMNLANCPPDLATYNTVLRKIFECETKAGKPAEEGESKFCAMMDTMEELRYRGNITPNAESWSWVMKECVKSGQFRLGYVIERVMNAEAGGCPSDLASANEANASKAKSEGKEHPGHLAKQTGVFESMDH